MKGAIRTAATMMIVGIIIGLIPGTAAASSTEAKLSTYTTSDEILWVKTSVSNPADEDLKVKVFAPKTEGKGRHLFQVCDFTYSGAGDYLCGIDVSEGSIASQHDGRWVGKAIVNKEVISKESFSI